MQAPILGRVQRRESAIFIDASRWREPLSSNVPVPLNRLFHQISPVSLFLFIHPRASIGAKLRAAGGPCPI